MTKEIKTLIKAAKKVLSQTFSGWDEFCSCKDCKAYAALDEAIKAVEGKGTNIARDALKKFHGE